MKHVNQNITNETILLLTGEDLHARALADLLKANHITVGRRLMDLRKDNIVDFRVKGKNKVFFLKRTIEGRNAAMMAEIYRQSLILSRYPVLRGIFRNIQEKPDIAFSLLFGSYAKGLAKSDSDIDIFVETMDNKVKNLIEKSHSAVSVKIGPFDEDSPLIREIMKDHVIIKGFEAYFDKTGFFKETQ
jgi:predicted nucleotidyltransferase